MKLTPVVNFSNSFCANILSPKKFKAKMHKTLWYENLLIKYCEIDTYNVDFTNILWAAFRCVDPKSLERYWRLDDLFTLLGSSRVKAGRTWWNWHLLLRQTSWNVFWKCHSPKDVPLTQNRRIYSLISIWHLIV